MGTCTPTSTGIIVAPALPDDPHWGCAMKPIPRALRAALAKLIRLLASDVDGEVLATVRALGRTLKASGCDIHDLAGLVEAPDATRPVTTFHNQFDDDDGETGLPWRHMVDACTDQPHRFTLKERQFLQSMRHWYGRPSSKQLDWLIALFERVREAA